MYLTCLVFPTKVVLFVSEILPPQKGRNSQTLSTWGSGALKASCCQSCVLKDIMRFHFSQVAEESRLRLLIGRGEKQSRIMGRLRSFYLCNRALTYYVSVPSCRKTIQLSPLNAHWSCLQDLQKCSISSEYVSADFMYGERSLPIRPYAKQAR